MDTLEYLLQRQQELQQTESNQTDVNERDISSPTKNTADDETSVFKTPNKRKVTHVNVSVSDSDAEVINSPMKRSKRSSPSDDLDCPSTVDSETPTIDHPTSAQLKILKEKFGHRSFRDKQWQIIYTSLIDKRDQCVIMATGYGKSLCFQFPSVYTKGLTLVISPLISLMEDQVMALTISGIPACFLGSAQTKNAETLDEICQNKYRLVYITPELCTQSDILQTINDHVRPVLIAIDEAHCISKWGHDFRAAFRGLKCLKKTFANVPILAVTATATSQVRDDIVKSLGLQNALITRTSFNRANLFFEVHERNMTFYDAVRPYLNEFPDSSVIVYALTKKETENCACILKANGIKCEAYHAGFSVKERRRVHEQFMRNELRVICATIAFGMGIDKPDVRAVIHYGASKDLESYYQEVGRAGRDGAPAKCVTFFGPKDFITHEQIRRHANVAGYDQRLVELSNYMKEYLYSTECRRKIILKYFEGADFSDEACQSLGNCCDNCSRSKIVASDYKEIDVNGEVDLTENARLMLKVITALNGRYGMAVYVHFLRGLKHPRINKSIMNSALYGSGLHKSTDYWKMIGRVLEQNNYVTKKYSANSEYAHAYTIDLTNTGRNLMESGAFKMKPTVDILKFLTLKTKPGTSTVLPTTSKTERTNRADEVTAETIENCASKEFREKLLAALKEYRNELARDCSCPPHVIANDTALTQIAVKFPRDYASFASGNFNDFNDRKIERFALRFVQFIQQFLYKQTNLLTLKQAAELCQIKVSAFGNSAQVTYALFTSSKSLEDIAKERQLAIGTVKSHLIAALKSGAAINIAEFVPDRDRLERIVRTCAIIFNERRSLLNVKLTEVKNATSDVEWDEVNAVLSYFTLRETLKANDFYDSLCVDHDDEPYRMFDCFRIDPNAVWSDVAKKHSIVNESIEPVESVFNGSTDEDLLEDLKYLQSNANTSSKVENSEQRRSPGRVDTTVNSTVTSEVGDLFGFSDDDDFDRQTDEVEW